jgi:1-hydroxy-2-naphthoate dioxygenase
VKVEFMTRIHELNEELRGKNLGGYWQVMEEVYREPSSGGPWFWSWADVDAAIAKAGEIVSLDSSARRVIRLLHPRLSGATSPTLQLNIQMLKAGEHAVAHRHTLAGIRFVIKGRGASCTVEGETFDLQEGDLLTTPNWTWHEHKNRGIEPLVWLDGLDAPLVRLLLPEIGFFEPFNQKQHGSSRQDWQNSWGAMRPGWVKVNSVQPPAFCYKWAETERLLDRIGEYPGDPCDGIMLDYANPVTGGPTLPTMACALQMLRSSEKTASHRHTYNVICHVFSGEGCTVVDGERYNWKTGDSFVIPTWSYHHHENLSDKRALLFVMNDRPLMETLGFYREEKEY